MHIKNFLRGNPAGEHTFWQVSLSLQDFNVFMTWLKWHLSFNLCTDAPFPSMSLYVEAKFKCITNWMGVWAISAFNFLISCHFVNCR